MTWDLRVKGSVPGEGFRNVYLFNSVDITTDYELIYRGSVPVKGKRFSSSSQVHAGCGALPAFYRIGTGGSLLEGVVREAVYSCLTRRSRLAEPYLRYTISISGVVVNQLSTAALLLLIGKYALHLM
jgi:hypothetical protein